jgi:hypothetical protein
MEDSAYSFDLWQLFTALAVWRVFIFLPGVDSFVILSGRRPGEFYTHSAGDFWLAPALAPGC